MDSAMPQPPTSVESTPLLLSTDEIQQDPQQISASSLGETSLLLRIGPGLLLGTFVAAFDLSYLATNYSGRIASDLHQLQNAVWIVLAGSIAGSCFQPLYAYCANNYGRRLTILAGSTITVVGLLLCSMSTRLWELSLSRVLVGMGSSGLGLLTTIIVNDVVPLSHLALWRSTITTTMTAGLMSGGPLGSKILALTNWHIPFILEGSLLLLAIGFLYATLRLPPAPIPKSKPDVDPRSFGKNDINYDIVGGVFMILALAMPLLALNMAGGIVPWSHPAVIVLLSLTPVLIAALFYIEGYLAKSPIFPTRFFTSVPVLLVNLCTIALIFSWNQIMFNLSFYAQIRDIYGNAFQNWVLTCVFVGQPIGSFSTGLFIQKTKAVKAVLAASILLSCLLYTGLAAGWIKPERPAFAPILVLFGFGIGASESSSTVALFGTVEKSDQAALYALFDLVVAFSGDIGITISSTMTRSLTLSYLREALEDSSEASEIIKGAIESLDNIRKLPSKTQILVIDSFVHAIQNTFVVSAVVMALSFVGTRFLQVSIDSEAIEEEQDGLAEPN
ncbi:major facilitator superfamily domain-containing protein [Halenospora varia]|nr:major facilitator superfamily domain-containing protein [Halenospora varia]